MKERKRIQKMLQCGLVRQYMHLLKAMSLVIVAFVHVLPVAASEEHKTEHNRSVASVLQNTSDVSGVVMDTDGEPLVGVTVKEKGTTNGTTTDFDGKFSLSVSTPNAILVFSYIGYKSQEIPIHNRKNIPVVLEEDVQALGEVVVVGYGTQSKVSLTGAVASVTSRDIQKSSSVSFGNALQGRLTGLSSTQTGGGMPGMDDAEIYLRGAATLNGKNPLILIDGVPRDNIRTMDVNEVESVSVLKDASATAVFGVRGANGVIIITTKRGKAGEAKLSVTASQSFTSFTRKPERLSSLEYIDLRNEAFRNDGNPEPYSAAVRAMFENPLAGLNPSDPDYSRQALLRHHLYPNHYYYEEYFKTYAPESRINANAQGGTDKVLYFINIGYVNQGGHLKTEKNNNLNYNPEISLNRWSFRANMDYKMARFLSARLNIGTYIEKQNTPNTRPFNDTEEMMRGIMQEVMRHNPTMIGPTTLDGIDENVEGGMAIMPRVGDNPAYALINRNGYHQYTRINLNSSFEMDFDLSEIITKGLIVKGMVAYDSYPNTTLIGQRSEKSYYADGDYENNKVVYSERSSSENPMSLTRSHTTNYRINGQVSINYDRTFGDHTAGGMLLAQRDYWEHKDPKIPFNLLGVVARATYNYKSRYFGEFNFGYNGSEQFAPDNRFGSFPAFSVAWIASEESFFPKNNVLTFLKARFSYGRVGNDKLAGEERFLYMDDIQLAGSGIGVGGLGLGQKVNISLMGNKSLQWEVADKLNVGLDFHLFKDLSVAVDFFNEKRTNILIQRGRIPVFQGLPESAVPRANLGEVDNRGLEVELNYNKQITKDFRVRVRGNFAINKNEVKYRDEARRDDTYYYAYRETGYPIGQSWGYLVDWDSPGKGYWTSQEEIDASGLTYSVGKAAPGGLKYIDLNGDGELSEKDYAPLGHSSVPGLTYGLDIGFDYKDFDFSVLFSGIGRYSTIWTGSGVYETLGQGSYFGYHKNAWTEERYRNGDKITYPALSAQEGANHVPNEFFLQNRSFVRLKNMELGYTIPENILKSIGISSLRVYVTGQNLFLWDKLKLEHQDPEKTHPLRYPITRSMGFGLNVTF